jgi:hypothetical protein
LIKSSQSEGVAGLQGPDLQTSIVPDSNYDLVFYRDQLYFFFAETNGIFLQEDPYPGEVRADAIEDHFSPDPTKLQDFLILVRTEFSQQRILGFIVHGQFLTLVSIHH